MTYLLDTSTLVSHWLKGKGFELAAEVLAQEAYCSVLSLLEFGTLMRTQGVENPVRAGLLRDYEHALQGVFGVDSQTVELADWLRTKTTTRLPTVDALIAATALQHKAILIHADNHFRSIPHACLVTVDIRDAPRSAAFPSSVRETASRYGIRTNKAGRGNKTVR